MRRIRVTGTLARRRLRQGRHPDDHPAARRERRRRLRLRVCRRRHRAHVDGRADDDLQHVDRGRRPGRLRQPGRDHVRVHARASVRAGGRGVRAGARLVASMASDPDARYDDEVEIRAEELTPVVTWGVNPGQSVGVDGRVPSASRCRVPIARRSPMRSVTWGSTPGQPIAGMQRRRGVHRVVHQLAPVGSARGGAHRPGAPCGAARQGAGRAGLGVGQARRRARRAGRDVPRGRLRVARRRLLDVPGDEPRQARRRPGLRGVVQPQLQGAAGQPDRAARCS